MPRTPSAFPFSERLRRRAINPTPPKRVKAWGEGPLRPEVMYPVVEHTRPNRAARNHSRSRAPHHRTQKNARFFICATTKTPALAFSQIDIFFSNCHYLRHKSKGCRKMCFFKRGGLVLFGTNWQFLVIFFTNIHAIHILQVDIIILVSAENAILHKYLVAKCSSILTVFWDNTYREATKTQFWELVAALT